MNLSGQGLEGVEYDSFSDELKATRCKWYDEMNAVYEGKLSSYALWTY